MTDEAISFDDALVANGLVALLRHPGQLAAFRADPTVVPGAVDELLRYDTPTQVRVRSSDTETTIGGTTVPAGQPLALLLGSANRDPRRFTDPDVLDLARVDNPHVSFGHGLHLCIGAPLVRIVGRIALGTLVRRFPDLALAVEVDELRWSRSLRFRELLELPVTL